jgi:hypothetical protein
MSNDNDNDGEEAPAYDWSAYYDDNGLLYYYNSVTEESSWTAPDGGFHPAPPVQQGAAEEGPPVEAATEQESGSTRTPPSGDSEEAMVEGTQPRARHDDAEALDGSAGNEDGGIVSSGGGWVAYTDDEGREYFYNAETGATQWEKPEDGVLLDLPPPETEGDDNKDYEPPPDNRDEDDDGTQPSDDDDDDDEVSTPSSPVHLEPEREPTPEPEIDPKVKLLQDAETGLNLPDSILELGCIDNVNILLQELGGSEGGQKAMQALVTNFHSQTAICGLLGQWLTEMKGPAETEDAFEVAANEIREDVQEVISKIAKERFTKAVGDSIFTLKKTEAVFLDEMMDSERWRKLLIDLSATNKDSTLLKFCLRSISNRGHHREIIKRINPSDHFAVFNAMLASEFAVMGKIALGATSDLESTSGMSELVDDLRRTCTSTSYTYLYAVEVLRYLVEQATQSSEHERLREAIRKWERLKEELENAMVDPSMSSTTAGSSTLFRKRRLEVALTISELQQQQRRRLDPNASNGDHHNNDRHQNSLETALLALLKKSAVGMPLEDNTLEQLLPKDGGDGTEVGKLLMSHPLAIKALVGHLFRPGAARVSSLLTRAKCAHLVALAVMAAEKVSCDEAGQRNLVDVAEKKTQEEQIKGMLLTGSQMCELVENMVSFTVSSNVEENNASAGMKLCALALKSAPVAQGVVIWATEIVRGTDFVTSASYPTLSPCILSLVRIVATKHPFTRRTVMNIALAFLGHTNSEISSQKMNSLKEQSLRLLVVLLTIGEVASVCGTVSSLLNNPGASVLDSSLLRYFVSGILDVIKPPYSLVMIRAMGAMLSSKMCVEAIRSKFFGDVNQLRLKDIVARFNESIQNGESLKAATAHDKKLISLLVAAYC